MPRPPDLLTLARAGHAQSIVQVVRTELLRRRWCARVDFADETLHVHLLGSLYQPALSPSCRRPTVSDPEATADSTAGSSGDLRFPRLTFALAAEPKAGIPAALGSVFLR